MVSNINASQLPIDNSLPQIDSIENFIAPYRKRINEVMDAPLAYAPNTLTKADGEFNTSAGNLLADAILEQASPIFKSRTGKDVDFVVFNHGGVRAIVSKGQVTTRTAYQVMPFENRIAVVELSGTAVRKMVGFLMASGRPHPIAGIQIVLDKDGSLQSVTINGEPFDEERTYRVATSDYLVQGGDEMGFFKDRTDVHVMEYLVRNALIDYFKANDTLVNKVDHRFIKL
ncbi:5'-nucleotidase [Allomuricauda sp. d1]|uniref:5'-nucleotidase n=1 Tax=Allomuricauda sp. d1 TaxID=3136725 RepID=UPI0031DC1FC9